MQGVDTRGECLDAAPEQPGKSSGTRVEAGVVQRGLTLAQIVDEQISDRLVLDRVAVVDELFDRQLPTGAPNARMLCGASSGKMPIARSRRRKSIFF